MKTIGKKAAQHVLSAPTNHEAYLRFQEMRPLLTGWRFLLAASHGGAPTYTLDQSIADTGVIRGVFRSPNVLMLDEHTDADMRAGRPIACDYSISLDLQAASYLRDYYEDRKAVPESFRKALSIIASQEVNVDVMPYLFENLRLLQNDESREHVVATVKAFKALSDIDYGIFERTGAIVSSKSDDELKFFAEEAIDGLKLRYEGSLESFNYLACYCFLLKITQIQLGGRGQSVSQKMKRLLAFQHDELATVWSRETTMAYAYFRKGQDLKFFSAVQSGNRSLFEKLQNMSWDLWHIRYCEGMLNSEPEHGARYFYPALLTFDAGMTEIIDMYGLRGCAILKNEPLMPFFDAAHMGGGPEGDENVNQYLTLEAVSDRARRRKPAGDWIKDLIGELEQQVARLAKVPVPT